jgi:large subunit ribosomal protein L31
MLVNFANPNRRDFIEIIKNKKNRTMKNGIHPGNYRFVVFQDMSNGTSFLSKSTAPSKENIKWEDGNEYPLIKLEISNTSHPFYTGKMKLVDTAGRVDKFMNRYKDHVGKKK